MQIVINNDYNRGFRFEGKEMNSTATFNVKVVNRQGASEYRVSARWTADWNDTQLACLEQNTRLGWITRGEYPAKDCTIDGQPVLREPTEAETEAVQAIIDGADMLAADPEQVLTASGLRFKYPDSYKMEVRREDWSSPVVIHRTKRKTD